MRARTVLVVMGVVAVVLSRGVASAQSPMDADRVFQERVAQYLELRVQLTSGIAAEMTADSQATESARSALARRIQKARATAQIGDVIPAAFAETVRDRLHRSIDPAEVDVLFSDLYLDGFPALAVQVNCHYEPGVAVVAPIWVLSALPPLPAGLGYRLIGLDVVLWDEDAQLVIDVFADAIPKPRVWEFLDVSSCELRQRITTALHKARLDARELADDLLRDSGAGSGPPVVGELFDWDSGGMMPPSLLHALPQLPAPLEYRLVGPHLVVIDIPSGVVRGVLWNVLPRRATGVVL